MSALAQIREGMHVFVALVGGKINSFLGSGGTEGTDYTLQES